MVSAVGGAVSERVAEFQRRVPPFGKAHVDSEFVVLYASCGACRLHDGCSQVQLEAEPLIDSRVGVLARTNGGREEAEKGQYEEL